MDLQPFQTVEAIRCNRIVPCTVAASVYNLALPKLPMLKVVLVVEHTARDRLYLYFLFMDSKVSHQGPNGVGAAGQNHERKGAIYTKAAMPNSFFCANHQLETSFFKEHTIQSCHQIQSTNHVLLASQERSHSLRTAARAGKSHVTSTRKRTTEEQQHDRTECGWCHCVRRAEKTFMTHSPSLVNFCFSD